MKITVVAEIGSNWEGNIIKAKKINTHGGSIRVYATKKGKYKIDNTFEELINIEKKDINSLVKDYL